MWPIILHAMIRRMKRRLVIGFLVLLAATTASLIYYRSAQAPVTSSLKPDNKPAQQPPLQPGFDKKRYSLEDPTSPWVVVNKKRPLPATYIPQDLTSVGAGEQMRAEAGGALKTLLASAKSQGINLSIISGYRSYQSQSSVYSSYVKKDGQAAADTYSARPGHSEHQSGLAVDLGNGICDLQICFGDTSAGKWLTAHAYESGFIIRYQKGWEGLTGYQYEPWHIRYVGPELAAQLNSASQTMEQFFGLPVALSY